MKWSTNGIQLITTFTLLMVFSSSSFVVCAADLLDEKNIEMSASLLQSKRSGDHMLHGDISHNLPFFDPNDQQLRRNSADGLLPCCYEDNDDESIGAIISQPSITLSQDVHNVFSWAYFKSMPRTRFPTDRGPPLTFHEQRRGIFKRE